MQAIESSQTISSLALSGGENPVSLGLRFTLLKLMPYFSSQSQVSNDPKQQAKDKRRNSIPLPRKDYDWLDKSM